MPRVFAGIEIPDEIGARLALMRTHLGGARWTEPNEYHLTLRFFGELDRHRQRDVVDGLAGITVPCFPLRLSGIGSFGGDEPRTVYATVEANDKLTELQRATERVARAAGLSPEPRKFTPHVTLGRFRSASPVEIARYLDFYGGFRAGPFTVERMALFSARPGTGGGPYIVEEDFPLAGAGIDWDESDEPEA